MDTVMSNPETHENVAPSVRSVCFTRSPDFKNFIAAMLKAQAAIKGAKKDSKNDHFKTSYADMESVIEAIAKPLNDNGIMYMQWPVTIKGGIELETILFHVSGEWASGTLEMPATQVNAHGIGSAITYARRYGLMAAVGLAPVDDDGNAASHGAPGTAGSGTQFRPERRQQSSWGEGGKASVVADAEKDGLTANAKPKALPGAPAGRTAAPIKTATEAGNAVKRIEWVKASVAYLSDKDEHVARDWWVENKVRIDVIETALPTEFERLLDAYNEALERKVPALDPGGRTGAFRND